MCEIAKVLKHLTGFLNKEASPRCLEANDSSPTKSSEVDQSCELQPGKGSHSNGSLELAVISTPDYHTPTFRTRGAGASSLNSKSSPGEKVEVTARMITIRNT